MKEMIVLTLIWAAIALGLAGVIVGVTALVSPAHADAPVLIHTEPLPCLGTIRYWDTNGDPSDGAELVTVHVDDEREPRATVEYASGKDGGFLKATVTIPEMRPQVFTDADSLQAVYPHPCHIVVVPVGQGA